MPLRLSLPASFRVRCRIGAGEEFGGLRGTIAAAGILLPVNLLVPGMPTGSWLDDGGDLDPFNHLLGEIPGGPARICRDVTAIRALHRMQRP